MSNPAPASAGASAPRQRGTSAGRTGQRAGPAMALLNPERAPGLIAKWQKLLGKDLDRIEVTYEADGVSVYLYGKEGTPYFKDNGESLSIPEYRELKARETAPSDEEALQAFRDKYELRLNRPFPADGPASGSDADLRAFLESQPFNIRRAMLMSNKQFKTAYPNGFPQA